MSVSVLCPNGHRVTVKTTPNMSILQIIEDACKKHTFDPDLYDIKHLRRVLDTSSTVRYSNIPNKCQLELVEAASPRVASLVNVNIRTEIGITLTKDFPSTSTLMDIIQHLSVENDALLPNSSEQEIVLVYSMRRISGDEMEKVTLKSLGLTRGKCMMRHSFQSCNRDMKTLPHVAPPLRKPVSNDPLPSSGAIRKGTSSSQSQQLVPPDITRESVSNKQPPTAKSPVLPDIGLSDFPQDLQNNQLQNNLPNNPPEILANNPPEILSNKPPEILANNPPEILANNPPEILPNNPPEILQNSIRNQRPEILQNNCPEIVQNNPPELLQNNLPSALQNDQALVPDHFPMQPSRPNLVREEGPDVVSSSHSIPDIVQSQNHVEQPDLVGDMGASPMDLIVSHPCRLNSPTIPKVDSTSGNEELMEVDSSDQIVEQHNEVILIGDHDAILFDAADTPSVNNTDEDESFYDLTVNEVKRLYQDYRKTIVELDNQPLMTKQMREVNKQSKLLAAMNSFPVTQLRIYFPDNLVIQASFKPHDKISTVKQFLRQYLATPNEDFSLYNNFPRVKLNDDDTLVDAECIPKARLYFSSSAPKEKYLTEDTITKKSSFSSANAVLVRNKTSNSSTMKGYTLNSVSEKMDSSSASTSSNNSSTSIRNRSNVEASSKKPKWFKLGK